MSRIGIIGAMEEEVIVLKNQMENLCIEHYASLEFYCGTLKNKQVVVVKCGIGKVNAALCTQILIDLFDVTMLINTGVAGSLNNQLDIADIVISCDAMQHDIDATVFGYDYGIIPRMDVSIFQADKKLIEVAKEASKKVTKNKTLIGRIISGDQFISDNEKKTKLYNDFKGFCTEMEGAAIAHVCHLNNTPFVIIRSISDKADNTADMTYTEFTKIAVESTKLIVERMLELI